MSVTQLRCAKTGEQIEILFGVVIVVMVVFEGDGSGGMA